ncbi:MAG TPA: AAA family ATPase, partial [Hyphomicrobium sp.]|nr:AAA family ATPase [Hyphomicrobium sp.]
MKINAIRLKEVGRFSAPVALEGLSGGLDVLAGPNEFGKSTIVRALRMALFEQHRSKHRKLEAFRPYAGGAPLIEVDFETGGSRWRIRKQFLSSPSAELRDLQSGHVARGPDAEARLAELLGGPGHFALLYAEQGLPFTASSPLETGGTTLMSAIESEIENVADGSVTRTLTERVRAELATLLTAHSAPRPAGIYKEAIEKRDALARDLDAACKRLAVAQERLDALEGVRAELARLSAPETAEARERLAKETHDAFNEGRAAHDRLRTALEAVATHEKSHAAQKALLAGLETRIAELEMCERAVSEVAEAIGEAEADAKTSAERLAASREERDSLRRAGAALEAARKAREAAERLRHLAERLQSARAAHTACVAALAQLDENRADPAAVEMAERTAASIERLEARLSTAAPRVSIALLPAGIGRITSDGRALADGVTLNPTRPLTLDIEGIGSITVAPGHSQDVERDEAALADEHSKLARLLRDMGVASLDDAKSLLAVRREAERELQAARIQLKAVAPEGVDRLERTHDDWAAEASRLAERAAIGADGAHEPSEESAEDLVHALHAAEDRLAAAEKAEKRASSALSVLRERLAGASDRAAKLTETLGPPAAREIARNEYVTSLEAAQTALNAAVREATAWREKAPDEARLVELQRAAQAAATVCEDANRRIARLREDAAGLESALRVDRADDVAARVAELSDKHAAVDARCRDLEEEAAALQLLARELDGAAQRTRDRFTRPVIARLEPYLQLVMPDAQVMLGEDLAPQALRRGTASEDLVRLSDGTQEQLALLVRL